MSYHGFGAVNRAPAAAPAGVTIAQLALPATEPTANRAPPAPTTNRAPAASYTEQLYSSTSRDPVMVDMMNSGASDAVRGRSIATESTLLSQPGNEREGGGGGFLPPTIDVAGFLADCASLGGQSETSVDGFPACRVGNTLHVLLPDGTQQTRSANSAASGGSSALPLAAAAGLAALMLLR